MVSKHCTEYVTNLEDPALVTGLEKSILIQILKKGSNKECSKHQTAALISHASKVILKILHFRIQHYANEELSDVQVGLEKAEEPEIKLSTFAESQRKQGNSRKTSTSVSLTMLKPLTTLSPVHSLSHV